MSWRGMRAMARHRAGINELTALTIKAKFVVHGEEMLDKTVTLSGKSGRVYLPHEWLGKRVKIIRID